jgi:hypothetical protein
VAGDHRRGGLARLDGGARVVGGRRSANGGRRRARLALARAGRDRERRRVAILPVLAQTLPVPPPAGPLWVGSFALLYVQLLLPTPSGAGAVELGFLGGAAGELGGREGSLLLEWRFYTNAVGLLLGVWLAIRIYGWPTIREAVRRVAARGRPAAP